MSDDSDFTELSIEDLRKVLEARKARNAALKQKNEKLRGMIAETNQAVKESWANHVGLDPTSIEMGGLAAVMAMGPDKLGDLLDHLQKVIEDIRKTVDQDALAKYKEKLTSMVEKAKKVAKEMENEHPQLDKSLTLEEMFKKADEAQQIDL
ncbi:hypothetical protein PVAG01_04174 [Phlyctema vagabunda]|uniref:Uncharacterized protein n=1 Tax=Phlyctema vagabunda TaxID=108571 RepID=A0ABR4PNG2_9HELO